MLAIIYTFIGWYTEQLFCHQGNSRTPRQEMRRSALQQNKTDPDNVSVSCSTNFQRKQGHLFPVAVLKDMGVTCRLQSTGCGWHILRVSIFHKEAKYKALHTRNMTDRCLHILQHTINVKLCYTLLRHEVTCCTVSDMAL